MDSSGTERQRLQRRACAKADVRVPARAVRAYVEHEVAAVRAVVLQRARAGEHTLAGAGAGYGTAFWASAGLTAFAIIPCVLLLRAERAARAARGETPPEPLAEATPA